MNTDRKQLPPHPYRFEDYLPRINAEALKSMVLIWGGNRQMRKQICIKTILNSLQSPDKIKAALAQLTEFESTALALLKEMGGLVRADSLAMALLGTGFSLASQSKRVLRRNPLDLIYALIRKGLILSTYEYDPATVHDTMLGYTQTLIFADSRLLALHQSEPTFQPLNLPPLADQDQPLVKLQRHPPRILLEVVGLLKAIEDMKGLGLTKTETIRVNDLRKLKRSLKWESDEIEIDGLTFPHLTEGLIDACMQARLLVEQDGRMVLNEALDTFADQDYITQMNRLFQGFSQAQQWCEIPQNSTWFDPNNQRHRQGRDALIQVIRSLPFNAPDFFSLVDFNKHMFERIGRYFQLSSPFPHVFAFTKTKAERQKLEDDYTTRLRNSWQAQEQPWIEKVFSTWLYYLGLVELAVHDGVVLGFRLTKLGQAIFHPHIQIDLSESSEKASEVVWVVQPNFEIVVYLDKIRPDQLVFLEAHAERLQAEQYIAQYRLTQTSVYQGLERGTRFEELVTTLEAGADQRLPQNILVELQAWSNRREQVTLRRQASLLTFDDEAKLAQALAQGLQGQTVGDRFLLLAEGEALADRWIANKIDYAKRLPRCITVNEGGLIRLKSKRHDLLIESQLDKWATRIKADQWQLTAESVTAVAQTKAALNELLDLFRTRLSRPIPPLLEVALRAWAGEAFQAQLEPVVALYCPDEAVRQALIKSKKMTPFFRAMLKDGLVLVDQSKLADLKATLAWTGLIISETLRIE